MTITADVGNVALKIAVVGAIATNISWAGNLDLTEVGA